MDENSRLDSLGVNYTGTRSGREEKEDARAARRVAARSAMNVEWQWIFTPRINL
jgi:hypothetical protein